MATRRQRTWFARPCPSLYPRPALSPSLPVSPRTLGRRKTAAAGRQAYGSYFKINVAPRSARCAVRAREWLKEAREVGWLFRSLDDCSFLQRVRGVPLSAPSFLPGPFRPRLPSTFPSFLLSFPASVLPSAQSLPINEGLNRRPLGQTDSPSLLLSPLFPSLPPPCSRNVRDLARDLLRAAAPSEHVCLVDRT